MPPPTPTPLWYLFDLDTLIPEHPLWLDHARTVPCIRADVRLKYTADGKQAFNPARSPADSVGSTVRAIYRMLDDLSDAWGPKNRPFNWYLIPAGLGKSYPPAQQREYLNATALLDHPDDRLASGRTAPWAARGIQLNRQWATAYFDQLARELAFRKLPAPVACIITSENGPGDRYDAHIGPPASPDRGWVPEALDDPRSSSPDHTIDGVHTFKEYFEHARTLNGDDVPEYNGSAGPALPPGRHPLNFESSERARGALRRVWEYSRYQAFALPASTAFPNVMLGEYQAACDSKSSPVPCSPTLKLHQMDGFFRCSLQCPDWYGGLSFLLDDAVFTTNHPAWNTKTNWCRALNITDPDHLDHDRAIQLAGLKMAKLQATAHARAAPNVPLAPYVFGLGDTIPVADMIDYLRHCRDLGAWGVNIFMPEASRQMHDRWVQVIEALEAE